MTSVMMRELPMTVAMMARMLADMIVAVQTPVVMMVVARMLADMIVAVQTPVVMMVAVQTPVVMMVVARMLVRMVASSRLQDHSVHVQLSDMTANSIRCYALTGI